MSINTKLLQQQAQEELNAERTEAAKTYLKSLYIREEKAKLALKNIQKEIKAYIAEIEDLATYQSAGVDVSEE